MLTLVSQCLAIGVSILGVCGLYFVCYPTVWEVSSAATREAEATLVPRRRVLGCEASCTPSERGAQHEDVQLRWFHAVSNLW